MNNIKTVFSIKDLENLSGIKAHTIRIWEKRYNALVPMRTSSNIRVYDLAALQKLLNIKLLHNHGYKISKISKLENDRIRELVNEITSSKNRNQHVISAMKVAMMNFDSAQFLNIYDSLAAEKPFRQIFYEVFHPLLEDLGFLWQTDTITPAHEHFISYLIKQKILVNTEEVQKAGPTNTDKTFVLFLPLHEVHELGLMYINYELLAQGHRSVYLGESVPMSSLKSIKDHFGNVIYISYLTCAPNREDLPGYLREIQSEILREQDELWILGTHTEDLAEADLPKDVRHFTSIQSVIAQTNEQ
ncbi:MAG: MerR family transcriptional regulator [Flavobacterium sp.]|nr:MerR family transcriptional regulator [Flavobacterium sp.]